MRVFLLFWIVLYFFRITYAETIAFIVGFETGDASEILTLGAGSSIQSATAITGGYSLDQGSTASTLVFNLNINGVTALGVRLGYRIAGTAATDVIILQSQAAVTQITVALTSSNILEIHNGADGCGVSTTTGSTALAANTNYTIRFVFDRAASGVIKVWLDDALEINTTHSSACTGTNIDAVQVGGLASPDTFIDDILIQIGGVAQPPKGRLISRQGKAGTPTYDGYTKTCSSCASTNCNGSCATSTSCCALSETPFGTAKNVSGGNNSAQTTLTCGFDVDCLNSGATDALTIATGDTVNVCKISVIGKRGSGGSPSANCPGGGADLHCTFKRLNGVDTSVRIEGILGTTDTYVSDCDPRFTFPDASVCWTHGAISYLFSAEHGVSKGSGTGRNWTAEDAWMMCDYQAAAAAVTPRRRILELMQNRFQLLIQPVWWYNNKHETWELAA